MDNDIINKFTSHLKDVLTRALIFTVESNKTVVDPDHLLWSITTQKGCIASEILHKNNVKQAAVRKLVGVKKTTSPVAKDLTPILSEDAKRMIEKAVFIAHTYSHRYVGTEHLLAAMLQIKDPRIEEFFKIEKINKAGIEEQLANVLKSTSRFPEIEQILDVMEEETVGGIQIMEKPGNDMGEDETEKSKTPALDYFTRDLTNREIAAKIDPVIARDKEIDRLMEILCRRTKNNPILLGEPGVGKTAVVEGLAKQIVAGVVPPVLIDRRILALDLASVIAGTVYRGEFESRMKQIINEMKAHPEIILFIDEIHTIMGAGSASGSLDAANMLKPALARGEIRCIGATTPVEYKKHIETDSALERRFQTVRINEPNESTSIQILRGIAQYYEEYHSVSITEEAIDAAVRLSCRYITDRFLPDKAIDLIDEAAAALRVHSVTQTSDGQTMRALEDGLKTIKDQKRQAIIEEDFDRAQLLKEEETILRQELEKIKKQNNLSEHYGSIGLQEIASVISRATGIPSDDLVEEERERLRDLHEILGAKVLGQTHVTEKVAKAILRSKTGIQNPNRPLASFLFVGPSGVGKTELARVVAKELFQNSDALIHLDMSEYSEGFTVSKLIGSPAGYVGYREGTKLTDKVKEKPYAVVLFDEFEKAHKDAQNLLLQILETGELADATGRSISFRNTIVIITSNVGLERYQGSSMGFQGAENELDGLHADIKTQLNEIFRPELLNRIDQILPFHHLSKEALAEITQLQLDDLVSRIKSKGYKLKYNKGVVKHLAKRAVDEKVGARAIRRIVQDEVESLVAKKLLAKRKPKALHIKLKDHKISVSAE